MLCKGEYPNNIMVNILDTDNAVISNTRISTQVNDELIITGVITVPNNLNTFIVNVSLSNNGGEFFFTPSFGFGKKLQHYIFFDLSLLGFLGPVTNIDSSIDECFNISVSWTAPTVDDRVSIQYYILRIYDAITGSLVDTVSVYDTSYQFVNNNLFIHRFTYVITGVNELGEGISGNNTFSYQRGTINNKQLLLNKCLYAVLGLVTEAGSDIITFNETNATASFNIPVRNCRFVV